MPLPRPIIDRIIVKRLVQESNSSIVTPDIYQEVPVEGTVVSVPDQVIVSGVIFNTDRFVRIGDVVRFADAAAEDVKIDGELFTIVRLQDVKYVR